MECMSGMMMFGMGLVWLLVVVVLILGAAALIKYLFSSGGKGEGRRSSYRCVAAAGLGLVWTLPWLANRMAGGGAPAAAIALGKTVLARRRSARLESPLPSGRMPAPGPAAVVGGGYQSDMPGFGNVLTDEEIRAVLAFIKSTWPERERAYQADEPPGAGADTVRPILAAEPSNAPNRNALSMKAKPSLAIQFLALILATSALAHHPGADLDKMRDSAERFFQAIDEQAAPPFELADADGRAVRLSDFSDKIVVLYFMTR